MIAGGRHTLEQLDSSRVRDGAYHQSTVCPWLLGHFVEAWLRAFGDRHAARAMPAALPDHVRDAGIGSVSEIFDAESPYEPRGCIAQRGAWRNCCGHGC